MSSLIKTIAFNQPKKAISNILIRTFTKAELPQFETLAVSIPKKYVYHVELNRPKKSNSFSRAMWQEINQCFTTLSVTPECRVIVLSGQGKHFCGGIELQSLVQMAAEADELEDVARKARFHSNFIKYAQETISSLEDCVKPVLTVTHNACIGAGVNLITAADMRYCTEDAWFSVREVDVGLAPDVGTLQRLPKIVGNASIARELCFTGRNFNAKEAKEIGLVSQVFTDKETALKNVMEIAENIAAKSPVAVQTTKINLVYSQSRPNKDGLEHIIVGNASIARELCFTGRNFNAKEAKEIGLVSQVFTDKETALKNVMEIAENIAAKSPVAVQTTKINLVYSQSRPNKDGLEHIRLLNSVMNQGEDLTKAAIAQATKSPPPEFDNV